MSDSWLERQMAKAEKLMGTLPDDVLAWQHLHIQPARNQGKRLMSTPKDSGEWVKRNWFGRNIPLDEGKVGVGMSEQIPSWAADLIKKADPNPKMPQVWYDQENYRLEVLWKLESYNVKTVGNGCCLLIGIESGESVGVMISGLGVGLEFSGA